MNINDIKQRITPVLGSFGVKSAAIFGSFSRGGENPESDVDLLVSFHKPMGMFLYMKLINTLESVLGRRVDVVTENSLNKHVKPYIMSDLKIIYES